jgi:hypothetical protein
VEADVPPQGLVAGVGVFIGGVLWAIWQYVQTWKAQKAQETKQSPVGDLRLWGAALNDSAALRQIAEQLECLCDHSKEENKHLETIADELTAIRKIMGRREDRGGRQES